MSTLLRYISTSLLALALLVLVACAPAATPTSAPQATNAPVPTAPPAPTAAPTTAPQPTAAPTTAPTSAAANTFVYLDNIDDIVSLDPAVAYEFSGVLVDHNIYEGLVTFLGDDLANLKPGLADKWTSQDQGDHVDITFHLRAGAKFASGNPVTADDVVYSFQRVIALNKSPAFLFTDDAGLTKDSIKAADAQDVVVSVPKTSSSQGFLSILTFTVGGIVDSKTVKAHEQNGDFGSGWLLDHSAGSGPYVIDHWTKDVEVLLTANPNAATAPKLSRVLIKHVPESTNQQAALEKGDADVVQNLTPEQITAETGKANIATIKANDLLLFYIGMNVTVKPLDNVKVREAIRTAIDYDGIINSLLSGNGQKVQTIVPKGLFGYNDSAPFQQNVDAAKKLMSDAGVASATLDLLVPSGAAPGGIAWSDLAAKVQADLAKINITVNLKQVAQADLLGSYRAQKGQLVMILWGPDFPDPDGNGTPFSDYAAKSLAFRNAWNDSSAATQAHAAALETDLTKRAADYKALTDYVLHNGPYVILYQPYQLFALSAKVKGFAWNPMGYADLWNVSK